MESQIIDNILETLKLSDYEITNLVRDGEDLSGQISALSFPQFKQSVYDTPLIFNASDILINQISLDWKDISQGLLCKLRVIFTPVTGAVAFVITVLEAPVYFLDGESSSLPSVEMARQVNQALSTT